MAREFTLPDVGEGVHEGELVEWLVEPGDAVREDQPVAKVETDKALVDVPAPVDGAVRELRWSEGDVVPVGEVLLVFDVEGEVDDEQFAVEPEQARATDADEAPATDADEAPATDADEALAAREASDSRGVGGSTEAPAEGDDGAPEPGDSGADAGAVRGGRVFAAPSARRLARELGVDVQTVEGSGPGGRITTQDVRTAAEAGADEAVTDEQGADAVPADAAATDSPTEQVEATPSRDPDADRDRTLATPATRRVAIEEGVDIDAVPPVEERDGEAFVTEEAVREYARAQQAAQAADVAATTGEAAGGSAQVAGEQGRVAGRRSGATADEPSVASGQAAGAGEGERREPYRGVRRSIGEAMATSKFTAPHVTHHDEVDVTELVATKERLSERAETRGVHLTYVPFVLKAVTAALREFPILNSYLDEEAEEIVYQDRYDLGVATATDAGLMVPVVEGVDEKGLLDLAAEIEELTGRARDRSIAPEELRGSTFTVTNVGAIGGEYATPILNYPEVGILALGQIRRKPRVVEDADGNESIEPRSILPLSLSIDHRVVDGAEAAHFTNAVRERLRDPELLLLE